MAVYFAALASLAPLVLAQFPSQPTDLTEVTSQLDSDVIISYKETGICETTPGVRAFSGYVKLPPSALYDLDVDVDFNTYFLYFEARNDPDNAPLAIYLAGGPGESSAFVAMNGEGGPCYVNPDGNSTTLNPWSLNNYANVIYIDQPISTGFSYAGIPINGTYDAITSAFVELRDYEGDMPPNNATLGQGTYPRLYTTNTTVTTAQALWHFAEHWLTQFPEYTSTNKNIGVWGNSAGGIWATVVGRHFDEKIKEADEDSPLRQWTVDNVGVTNGMIDFGHAMPYYLEYAHNNPYGQYLDDDSYEEAVEEYEGVCLEAVAQCKTLADQGDPLGRGTNETVNEICRDATRACFGIFTFFSETFNASHLIPNPDRQITVSDNSLQVTSFDIATEIDMDYPQGDPCLYYFPTHTFLNQEWTQKELGVPLNFTYISSAVMSSFTLGGDFDSGTGGAVRTDKRDFEYLVDAGIKVALVYGDRDPRCPWNSGEGLALTANYTSRDDFSEAGYEFIQTNETYNGGAVRQFENLSFSRVFQAGHATNTYQPETVLEIFRRTILGKDVATGQQDVTDGFQTEGPSDSMTMINLTLPETPGTCMVAGSYQEHNVFAALMQEPGHGQNDTSNPGPGEGGSTDPPTENSAVMALGQLWQLPSALVCLAMALMSL